jgi:hypothetical protein
MRGLGTEHGLCGSRYVPGRLPQIGASETRLKPNFAVGENQREQQDPNVLARLSREQMTQARSVAGPLPTTRPSTSNAPSTGTDLCCSGRELLEGGAAGVVGRTLE